MAHHQLSLRRLLHDLKQELQNPRLNVVARPLEDDIFVWHGNVTSDELDGQAVHFCLLFNKDYPRTAPQVRLYHSLPHPNVRTAQRAAEAPGSHFRLALWDCIDTFDGWSCAYTVGSILVQLQALLLDDEFNLRGQQASLREVQSAARRLDLSSHCAHTGTSPWPAFPTAAVVQAAPAGRLLRATLPPPPVDYVLPSHVCRPSQQAAAGAAAALTPASQQPDGFAPEAAVSAAAPAAHAEADSWTLVSRKAGVAAAVITAPDLAAAAPRPAATAVGPALCSNPYALLQGPLPDLTAAAALTQRVRKQKPAAQPDAAPQPVAAPSTMSTGQAKLQKQLAKAAACPVAASVATSAGGGVPPAATSGTGPAVGTSASALKRFKRKQRLLAEAQAQEAPAAESAAPSLPKLELAGALAEAVCGSGVSSPGGAAQEVTATLVVASEGDASEVASQLDDGAASPPASAPGGALDLSLGHAALQAAVLAEVAAERRNAERQRSSPVRASPARPSLRGSPGEICAAMGRFGDLPEDVLSIVLAKVQPRDVAALASTCQGLRASAQDDRVWRVHLQRCFAGAAITDIPFGKWRQAYLLEANNAAAHLTCCVTKLPHTEVVLGLPLRYTTNPRTQQVDYIDASPELMSVDAFAAGVRVTPTNQDVQALLPVFIDADHFARALPHLARLLPLLAPERRGPGGAAPPPSAWLDVLPRIINTAIVLLASEGVHNSDAATLTLCHAHRLLLALTQHFNLWGVASARVHNFLTDPAARTKEGTPNTGWFLPLLTLTPKYPLHKVLPAVVAEGHARSILWICKRSPQLAKVLAGAPGHGDATLLAEALKGALVAHRLLMIHVAFMQLVALPRGRDLAGVMHAYDILQGVPSQRVHERVRGAVRTILAADAWPRVHQLLGLRYQGDAAMAAKLRDAWRASLARGYHKSGMDFSKVQKSGVSKILLRGAQYTAPPGLKRILISDHWGWSTGENSMFLDATVYTVARDAASGVRQVLEHVDFSTQESSRTRVPGAVRHSGDMMDEAERTGKHEVNVDLAGLGLQVDELYLVISAWGGSRLGDARQPFVAMCDPDTGMEMCKYVLDDVSMETRRRHTACVMCRVYRGGGQWHVQAMGAYGSGTTGSGQLERTTLRAAAEGTEEANRIL